MLRQAFNALIAFNSQVVKLRRYTGSSTFVESPCRVSASNYFRNIEGPSATIIRGREFVIAVDTITSPLPGGVRRGDKIIHPTFGNMAIDEIIEMTDVGGQVMGLRVRCEV